jgi:predicted transcriptional regulator
MEKIEIRALEKPDDKDPKKILMWFVAAFGLSSDDKDSIEGHILKDFAYAAKRNEGLSSSELKFDRDVARSTVIYHLNRLMEVGLVVKRGRKYHLRAMDMTKVIEEIEYDISREMQRMLDTAKEFDRLFDARQRKRIK